MPGDSEIVRKKKIKASRVIVRSVPWQSEPPVKQIL